MALDLNMDFLGGLAQKTNYANLMLQKQQMADANRAKELQYANTLNTLKQQDTNTALKFLEEQDKVQQEVANAKISEYDRKKYQQHEKEQSEKYISPLMEKYKGNPLEALKSEEGQTASLQYRKAVESYPELAKYQRDALIQAENDKRQALGYEPLKVFRTETKQWYTPEGQVEAKEAGLLPNLEAHPYVKPTSFDAPTYFQKLYPQTNDMDEYYKKSGRLPVNADVYAQSAVEKQYPSIQVGTPRYKEYYNTAKKAYEEQQKQGNSLFYKIPENAQELAAVREAAAMRGFYAREDYKANKKNEGSQDTFAVMPYSDVAVLKNTGTAGGFNRYDLVGVQKSMPLLPSDVPTQAVEFYTPSNTKKATKADVASSTEEDIVEGQEITEEGRTIPNTKVKILKDYKVVLLPVGDDLKTPRPNGKRYKIFVTATSGEGGDQKQGYVPYSVAEPIIKKAGYTYEKLFNELSEGLGVRTPQATQPQAPAQPQASAPATSTTNTDWTKYARK